ncbi:Lactonase, 7-bladed beta-propeller-domain-containing protein [Lineolata rhizophorae]|uniref:Lactonase, 7-bladed beta-propeller-domain-containing protein n=1 Tax=Lineolata rhizophorae TaxID=578093 RepID=A0A6A6NY35_9PEZI|nr:Lactonase, 7-bladed beta-propeller-domain-containing protein [Lineolata rhizophorae]
MAATLFASHYSGTVHTLTLDGSSLSISNTIEACGGMPSWLTYDAPGKTLYCSDETWIFGNGSISSIAVADDGSLTETANAPTIGGDVANVLYGGDDGRSYIAIAHYQTSTVSTFALPLSADAPALQSFTYAMDEPGPNRYRQDAPHPHEVLLDPTGAFLLAPDLGLDQIHMWAIDAATGNLTECAPVATEPGIGPRHGVFWTAGAAADAATTLFVANELGNSVTAYDVAYAARGCPALAARQTLSTFPGGGAAPSGAKVGEIRAAGAFLYASNRADRSFDPDDSVATFALSDAGAMAFVGLSSAHGSYPRTFAVNAAGDMLAIGDQTSSEVVVVARDAETGRLGDVVARVPVGEPGTPEAEDGLSAVVWAE